MAGHVAHIREMTNVYKILVGKPEGKRPVRKLRHKLEDNTKTGSFTNSAWGCGVDSCGSG